MKALQGDPAVMRALRGEVIYGDDFDEQQIAAWVADEEDGYHDLYFGGLSASSLTRRDYGYASLVEQHGYRWLPKRRFRSILGVGSADGAELEPLLAAADSITILEASDRFAGDAIAGKPVRYVKPTPSGRMPFSDAAFDLIVCFSALHHIPNVSYIIAEMHRVCAGGGMVLLREPTHSMGDWRVPRRGLTKRERGIPADLFVGAAKRAGFQVVRATRCMFPLIPRIAGLFGIDPWRSPAWVSVDRWICALPIWSRAYHAQNALQKLRPHSLALVLHRPSGSTCARPGAPDRSRAPGCRRQ